MVALNLEAVSDILNIVEDQFATFIYSIHLVPSVVTTEPQYDNSFSSPDIFDSGIVAH